VQWNTDAIPFGSETVLADSRLGPSLEIPLEGFWNKGILWARYTPRKISQSPYFKRGFSNSFIVVSLVTGSCSGAFPVYNI